MLTYGNWSHASSRIRALAYIPMLEETGDWKVCHYSRAPEKKKGLGGMVSFALVKRLYTLKRYWLIAFYPWELIFAQRIFLSPAILLIIKWRRIPLVYDFDDAIYLGRGYKPTANMVKNADSVIVSSNELEGFCARLDKNVIIVPSPIDSDRFIKKVINPDVSSRSFTIGWIGSPWTESYLEEVAEALRVVFREEHFKLLLIGASEKFNLEGVEIEKVPWSYQKEIEQLHRIDIGIMPLFNDEWSRGKGGYKLYQYMATGLPVVASPVGINTSIVDHGRTGFLAGTAEEWAKYLILLGKDLNLRKEMGKEGRRKVEADYSYNACFKKFNQTLREAAKNKAK